MDGASEWRILLNIVLPASKPVIGASVVFLGMGALGDFIWQMLMLQVPATKTYVVGLVQSTLNVYAIKNVGYDLAIGTMLFIPYLIVFSLSSRYFITGLTGSATKE
jgi:arabinogalactan oligomer/maltooligosaccharide transport system permease protein